MIIQTWRRILHSLERIQEAEAWRVEYKHFTKTKLSLLDELWCWRYEYLPETQHYYATGAMNSEDYLSDRRRFTGTKKINGDYAAVIGDKLVYHRVLNAWSEYLPPLYGTVKSGHFQAEGAPSVTPAELFEMLLQDESFQGLVLKPYRGSLGKGIHFLYVDRSTQNGCFLYKEQLCSIRDVVKLLREGLAGTYVVTGYVPQAEYARKIFPDATNTIRILVMRDPESDSFFLARAVHRFGSAQSAPVDGFSAGGYCAAIDLDTGMMGMAAHAGAGKIAWHANHPDTGSTIEGMVVPYWRKLCETVLRASEDLPFLNYIGWDVLVTDDEQPICFIEANAYTGVRFLQVHEPLLTDPRIRRFYEHHGVLA